MYGFSLSDRGGALVQSLAQDECGDRLNCVRICVFYLNKKR